MPWLPAGINWLIGGIVAAALLPMLSLFAGMPFWIALIASAAAGGGLVVLIEPGKAFSALDASGAARGKIEFARDLLTQAAPQAERLREAGKVIRTPKVADRVKHLGAMAQGMFAGIEKDPTRVDRVRRFLTYYLPRSAEIAEAYVALERSPAPDPARMSATGELIDRLDIAFTRYAANLQDAALDNLDIELKLLRGALDEDLGPATSTAAAGDPGKGSR